MNDSFRDEKMAIESARQIIENERESDGRRPSLLQNSKMEYIKFSAQISISFITIS